jgi:hypothetical protein
MTKTEMTKFLLCVGMSENSITAMENAFDIGYEQGKLQGMRQERALWQLSQFNYENETTEDKHDAR